MIGTKGKESVQCYLIKHKQDGPPQAQVDISSDQAPRLRLESQRGCVDSTRSDVAYVPACFSCCASMRPWKLQKRQPMYSVCCWYVYEHAYFS